MSTNDIIETSDALGEPLDLYRFTYGGGASQVTLAYCDSDFEVVHAGVSYTPVYIERGAVNASGSLDKSELEVEVSEDSDVADLFRVYPPGDVVGLTIFRCHYDADVNDVTTPQAIWIGRVLACARDGYTATLRCEPAVTSLRRVGLRRHYQYMCPHVLYGPHCRVIQADHTTDSTCSAVDPRTASVPGDIGDQYKGGLLAWTPTGMPQERRTILDVTYDGGTGRSVLTLAGNPVNLSAGDPVTLSKGCRHNIADCRDVFDNAPNFGGMPYIPKKNPHGTTSIYN